VQVYAEVPRSAKEDADNTGNVERQARRVTTGTNVGFGAETMDILH